MKNVILTLVLLFTSASVQATVDGNTRAYVVVQDFNSEEFFVERVPLLGCWGIAQGPQLAQFTAEYKVNNLGCGGDESYKHNINYLTCAKLVDSKESDDYMGFAEITLDISKCEAKNNSQFITMVRTAAKLNFPMKKGEVKLKLIK